MEVAPWHIGPWYLHMATVDKPPWVGFHCRFMPFWKPHWCPTEAKAILTSVLLQLQEITCLSVSIMLLVSLTFGIHRGLLLAIIFDILIAFVSAVPPPHGNPQDVVLPCEFMGVSSFSQTFLLAFINPPKSKCLMSLMLIDIYGV